MARTAMSSFSDAHELPEIPIIAGNLHRLILPRQSQIWAVLHAADSPRRLDFSLAGAFLGRMCLSGEIDRLTFPQWQRVGEAMALYRRAAPIIGDGISRHFGEIGPSWRHPTGWQAIRRISADNQSALVVMHTFASPPSSPLCVPLPAAKWHIAENFGTDGSITLDNESLTWTSTQPFSARVLLLSEKS
jgi:alpha-galactosidase